MIKPKILLISFGVYLSCFNSLAILYFVLFGIHHSSLNDLENGKIKKIDIEVLRKISEELDLSLELLMKAAGYNQVAYMFKQNGSSLDSKSTKDLKNLIEEYRLSF